MLRTTPPSQPRVEMVEITDPQELARGRARWERAEKNFAWLREHAGEVHREHRGKCLAIAGQELFVANTASEALALARAVHPEDDGVFVQYVPLERIPWIYAHQGRVVCAAPRALKSISAPHS